ncbi:MAG TPA: YetF domain-containing protein [Pseudolabrys sp.]|jgi:uncharacterized membrane protein YcaP (DUF421 family)|nr:YetF domain-containing protein [Pseudolabrys sp.]HEX2537881.1 YetF domain-containing protein [Pseudolabrys sp.]
MDSVIKAAIVYFALWAIIRISGRRTLGEMSAFDLVLFMIIGGSTQRAITGQDYSLTNALLLVATFIVIDIALSFVELRSPFMRRVFNGMPMILVENGVVMTARMRRARITEDNILEAARKLQGLERIDQIKFAILEATGVITIVPAVQAGRIEPAAAPASL